jgi:ribosome-interacting GTPase 1
VHKKIIEKELEGFGIRLNKQPPEIDFKKKDKGGITISRTTDTPNLDDDLIKVILGKFIIFVRLFSENIGSIVLIWSSNATPMRTT